MHKCVKCVAVGHKGVGKTKLLQSYSINNSNPPTDFVSNEKKVFTSSIKIENEDIVLQLWDTSGLPKNLRKQIYKDASIILICFSINSPESFRKAKIKWAREVKRYCKKIPFLLIGLQTDLRLNDELTNCFNINKQTYLITIEQGEKLAKQIEAIKYLECSAYRQVGVQTLFEEVVQIAVNNPVDKMNHYCNIL